MNKLSLEELGAILAGLRLLQDCLTRDQFGPNGALIRAIYTDDDKHEGLTVDQIDDLCDRLN